VADFSIEKSGIISLHHFEPINPVRELYSLTAHADGGIKPPSASKGNGRRLKSAVFSNGINTSQTKRIDEEILL